MNRGIALKWIRLLESGDYKFGKGALRDSDDCFCAVGVLLDFLDKSEWRQDNLHGFNWRGYCAIMPTDMATKCKIKSVGNMKAIYDLNDDSTSYQPIIDYLKINYSEI